MSRDGHVDGYDFSLLKKNAHRAASSGAKKFFAMFGKDVTMREPT